MAETEKTAFVTGAGSGIGLALARELAGRGVHVVAADVDAEAAQKAADEIRGEAMALDVSDVAAVEAAASALWRRHGGVDLAFANAGVMANARLLDGSEEAFDWIYGVNVKGAWAVCRSFGRRMAEAPGGGRLAITASEHALGRQHLGAGFYTASKHAVLGMADVLRGELPDKVSVSVFCPGLVDTRLHEADRFGVVAKADPGARAVAAEVMRRGMSAQAVAKCAVDGVERGDFLIVTHPNAFAAAERRFEEIEAAFQAQAPADGDTGLYDVETVVSAVLRDVKK